MIATGPGWELRWCGCRPDGDPATWDEAAADPAIVATLHGCLCPEHGLASLGQVDHVITDPPYDERINKHARSVNKHGQRSFVRYLNLGDAPTATARSSIPTPGTVTPAPSGSRANRGASDT